MRLRASTPPPQGAVRLQLANLLPQQFVDQCRSATTVFRRRASSFPVLFLVSFQAGLTAGQERVTPTRERRRGHTLAATDSFQKIFSAEQFKRDGVVVFHRPATPRTRDLHFGELSGRPPRSPKCPSYLPWTYLSSCFNFSQKHVQENPRVQDEHVVTKLHEMELADAAELARAGIEETLCYYAFPREHCRSLQTNNPLERILREVRRRTRDGSVPGWKIGAEAGVDKVAPRGWHEVGHAAPSRHEPPRGSERSSMIARAKNFGSPTGEPNTTRPTLQRVREKCWTLPRQ